MSIHPKAQDVASKIKYEWKMFSWVADRIKNEYQKAPQEEKNLLMENFLLHARVLKDFFINNPQQDDVSAAHFFEDPSSWQQIASGLCPYLCANRVRLNKKLAHLTYSRLSEEEKWDFGAIYNEVYDAWECFFSNLSDLAKSWFAG